MHNCSTEDCVEKSIQPNRHCATHSCKHHDCLEGVEGEHEYCRSHECGEPGCLRMTKLGGRYCGSGPSGMGHSCVMDHCVEKQGIGDSQLYRHPHPGCCQYHAMNEERRYAYEEGMGAAAHGTPNSSGEYSMPESPRDRRPWTSGGLFEPSVPGQWV